MQVKSGVRYGRLLSGFFARSGSWLAWLMAAFLGSYVIGLLVPDDGFSLLVDGWLASRESAHTAGRGQEPEVWRESGTPSSC